MSDYGHLIGIKPVRIYAKDLLAYVKKAMPVLNDYLYLFVSSI